MLTNLLVWIIRRSVPPLVGLVLYTSAFIFTGSLFIFAAGFTVTQTAVIEIAIVLWVFATNHDKA